MIVRTQDVKFTIDRKPQPRRVKLGFEGDNAVERLRFALPDLGEGQMATLMMSGAYANAVTLKADAGKWSVDLTAEVVGKSGEVEAYVRTENGGDIWQSDVIMLETGKVPDAEGDIEQRYPTAVGQMLTAMTEHSVEMEEQIKRAEAAADRAETAGSGGGSTGGADGEDGGYYRPGVSADGDLSWSASKPDMPGVETVNIRGPVGPDGAPGKDGTDATVTAENIAAALGYTPADAEKVSKLSEEKADKKDIPAPYTLPVATADTLGGVRVSSDFVVDGEKLAIADGLTLFDSVEVKEGEEIKKIVWNKEAPVKEYQVFFYFPKIAEGQQRVTAYMGSVLGYIPQGLMSDADRYGWMKHENRKNTFPFEGYYGAKEGYATVIPVLGGWIESTTREDMYISILAPIPFPVGTTVKVYVR